MLPLSLKKLHQSTHKSAEVLDQLYEKVVESQECYNTAIRDMNRELASFIFSETIKRYKEYVHRFFREQRSPSKGLFHCSVCDHTFYATYKNKHLKTKKRIKNSKNQ